MSLLHRIGAKLATFGTGVAVKKALDYSFDYGLYPVALLWFGFVWGGVIMTGASVVVNLAVIRAYDWSKRDWLLLETLKGLKEQPQEGASIGFIGWLLRKGDAPAFFILSWVEDPIVVTIYLRHGTNRFDGLARRDWMIFWSSTVVSNLFWILSLVSIFEIAEWLF